MQILTVNKFNKQYSAKNILQDFSMNIKKGTIHVLVGTNGIGKTTLIKAIVGLSKKWSGDIKLFDENLSVALRNRIFYLPEKFTPNDALTAYDFLELVGNFYKQAYDKVDIQKHAEDLYLNPKDLNLRISKMSKGMAQKIGLISGFLSQKELLIMDEPMSGLDIVSRHSLIEKFGHAKSEGQTIFITSHDIIELEKFADYITIIKGANEHFTMSLSQIKQKYQSIAEIFTKA